MAILGAVLIIVVALALLLVVQVAVEVGRMLRDWKRRGRSATRRSL